MIHVRPMTIYVFIFTFLQCVFLYLDTSQWILPAKRSSLIAHELEQYPLFFLNSQCALNQIRINGSNLLIAGEAANDRLCSQSLSKMAERCYVFQENKDNRFHWMVRCNDLDHICDLMGNHTGSCQAPSSIRTPAGFRSY